MTIFIPGPLVEKDQDQNMALILRLKKINA